LQQWLFTDQPAVDETQWRQGFIKRYGIDTDRLALLLGDATKQNLPCPFQIDDRTLRNDFATLEKLGWLQSRGTGSQRRYCKGLCCMNNLGTSCSTPEI
jgi:hypothetical protein